MPKIIQIAVSSPSLAADGDGYSPSVLALDAEGSLWLLTDPHDVLYRLRHGKELRDTDQWQRLPALPEPADVAP